MGGCRRKGDDAVGKTALDACGHGGKVGVCEASVEPDDMLLRSI